MQNFFSVIALSKANAATTTCVLEGCSSLPHTGATRRLTASDTAGEIGVEDHWFSHCAVGGSSSPEAGCGSSRHFTGRSVCRIASRSYPNCAMPISVSTADEIQSGWYTSHLAFVTTEFDLAKTFALIAIGSARGSDKRMRNERHAWTAYESAIRFLSRTDLSPTDAERLAAKQQQVEDLLQQLTGEAHS